MAWADVGGRMGRMLMMNKHTNVAKFRGGGIVKHRRYSKGQMAVLMSLVIGTLVGAMALGTDVGILYYNWVQLQKAADVAVVAGAKQLDTTSTSTILASALKYTKGFACLNGVKDAANGTTDICTPGTSPTGYADQLVSPAPGDTNDATHVSIKLQRTVPYYFAKVLGLTSGTVVA
jgi:uncharacterized membrane protein